VSPPGVPWCESNPSAIRARTRLDGSMNCTEDNCEAKFQPMLARAGDGLRALHGLHVSKQEKLNRPFRVQLQLSMPLFVAE
jgi:hypothetical protein